MIKSIKRIITISICIFIIIAPSMCDYNSFSYAEPQQNGGGAWSAVSTRNQMVAAWKTYCKSRNASTTHHDIVDSEVAKFTYNMLQKLARLANVDLDAINAYCYYRKSQNGFIEFWFDGTAVEAFNELYVKYLDEYFNGGAADTTTLYSGYTFTDARGNTCLVYVVDNDYNVMTQGTTYIYTGKELFDTYGSNLSDGQSTKFTLSFELSNKTTYTSSDFYVEKKISGVMDRVSLNKAYSLYYYQTGTQWRNFYGSFIIAMKAQDHSDLRLCTMTYGNNYSNSNLRYNINALSTKIQYNTTPQQGSISGSQSPSTPPSGDQNYKTNKPDIDDIVSDDDIIVDEPGIPDPPTQEPVPPDSVIPNPENPTINPGNPDFNFQMPDININWNLPFDVNNMPFPFSIPFDIKNFLEILDAEPIAPSYEFDFYILDNHVEYEIDLSQFDDAMEIIRNIELAGYCIFLIISTRALFHIY